MHNTQKSSLSFLKSDFKSLQNLNEISIGLIDNNFYKWNVVFYANENSLHEGAIFKGIFEFPRDYPYNPPTFKFLNRMWHPNIDEKGFVCISILHPPGEDEFGYEKAEERWSCVCKPDSIIVSILSLLEYPNAESPANIDAAKEFVRDIEKYKKRVRMLIERDLEEL